MPDRIVSNQTIRVESIGTVTDCGSDPVPARGGKRVREYGEEERENDGTGAGAPVVEGGGAPALSGERRRGRVCSPLDVERKVW